MSRFIVLRVDSDREADMLIQDITENPHEDVLTPRWSNHVHANLVAVLDEPPATLDLIA